MTINELTADAETAVPNTVFEVPLKGGCGTFTIETGSLSDEVMQAVFLAGLTHFFNSANGATKALAGITKLEGAELEARKAEVHKACQKTKEQLEAGQVPGKAKVAKASGAVQTEAMRLAKNIIKDLIKSNGQKVGAYKPKEITEAAKIYLERNRATIIKLAEKNLAERAEEAKGTKGLDLKGLFGAKADSEEVKAKPKVAPKRKAKGEGEPLSAAQAGKAAPRAKPKGEAHTSH